MAIVLNSFTGTDAVEPFSLDLIVTETGELVYRYISSSGEIQNFGSDNLGALISLLLTSYGGDPQVTGEISEEIITADGGFDLAVRVIGRSKILLAGPDIGKPFVFNLENRDAAEAFAAAFSWLIDTIAETNLENKFPVVGDDTAQVLAGETVRIDVLANDSDLDGDDLAISSVTSPSGSTVVIDDNGTSDITSDDTILFAAGDGQSGDIVFSYTVSDGRGGVAIGTVTVTVNGNAPPVARPDLVETPEDNIIDIFVLRNDFDPDGDNIEIVDFTDPAGGVVDLRTTPEGEQYFTYTPNANANGSDSFTYRIRDTEGQETVAQVDISVVAVNDPPTLIPVPISGDEDTGIRIFPLANASDVDGDGLVLVSAFAPVGWNVEMSDADTPEDLSDDFFIVLPPLNYFGTETVGVTISDGQTTASADYSVAVLPVNDAPVVPTISASNARENLSIFARDRQNLQSRPILLLLVVLPPFAEFCPCRLPLVPDRWLLLLS